jgi:ATP-binding cassette subfamily B protein
MLVFNSIKVITAGEKSKLYREIGWNILQNLFKGAPYGILFMVLLELFAPIVYQKPINIEFLTLAIVGLFITLLLQVFVGKKAYKYSYTLAYSLSAEARLKLGEHLRKLPLSFFKRRDPGDVAALLLQDMGLVENVFSHLFPDVIGSIVMAVILGSVLLIADWRLGAIAIIFVILALIFLYLFLKLVNYFGEKQLKSRNEAVSRMMEYLLGIKVLKAYNQTGNRFQRMEKSFSKLKKDSIKLEGIPVPLLMVYFAFLEIGFLALLIFGVQFMENGTLSIPIFLLFLIIGYGFYEPLKLLSVSIGEMRYMNMAADRVVETLRAKILPEPSQDSKIDRYDIEFEDVTFKYQDVDVIKAVSFHIPERSITALVGPSGSGKTTITSLIARFWDVGSGQIKIGGQNIKDLKNEHILSCMSMVFQDVYLFNDTIYNNIKIGNPNATKDDVFEVAMQANCHEFIQKLPDGYDTMVGEGGSTLSGGEKQRISIARAILKDAPIILLDEATASLDPENEGKIQEAIRELVKSKTVVVIAHRLYSISDADQIIVIDKGRVMEKGKHHKLLENQGTYRHLWDEQQRAHGWKFGSTNSE